MIRKIVLASILCAASTASAQRALDELAVIQFDPASATEPISQVEGAGIKIGEGTVLHPIFGLETGFESNVFFANDAKPAGILRLLGQIGASSLGGVRLNPNGPTDEDSQPVDKGSLQWTASARLAYDQPLSGDDTVRATGGLGVGARLRGFVNPQQTFTFGFDDNFLRLIRAANFETAANENRDINSLRLTFLLHPAGRTMSGYLYLHNTLDIFESQASDDLYPDRMDTRVGLHYTWQWRPRTQYIADASFGYISGFGSSPASNAKISSTPLLVRVGVATLLSTKTQVHASLGYTNGFYANNTASYSAPWFGARVQYDYSPLGRISGGYSYVFHDSANANFYRDHKIDFLLQQLVVPFAVVVEPALYVRQYEGVTLMSASSTTRNDIIFQITGGVHYNFRDWIGAGIDYKFTTLSTDFTYTDQTGSMVDLNYTRHELLAGLRVAM